MKSAGLLEVVADHLFTNRIGHALNVLTSTAALGLQLTAYRLFALPSMPLRFVDVQYMSLAMKIILVSYGADLLFGDLNPVRRTVQLAFGTELISFHFPRKSTYTTSLLPLS